MRSFAVIAAVAGLAAASSDWKPSAGGEWKPKGTAAPVYVTDVVTAYTTYCPSPTQLTHNGVTYTVTSATTLTISNCPCTVTRPVESATAKPSTAAPAPSKPVASSGTVAKPSSYFPSVPAASSVVPVASSTPTPYTGAANKASVAGAGLLAVLGAAAIAL